jgi:ribosome maturation factor RimP
LVRWVAPTFFIAREASVDAGGIEVRVAAAEQDELAERLRPLVARVVESMGLELVDLVLRGSRGSRLLRVDIDRAGVPGVDVGDCQRASREIGAALDQADPIPSHYTLEVSSPGIDRPIRTPDDIRRNAGRRVVVRATVGTDSQRAYRGRLVGHEEGCLVVSDDREGEVRIPLGQLLDARQEVAP